MIGTPDAAAVSGQAEDVRLVVDEEESVCRVRSAPDCLSVSPSRSTIVVVQLLEAQLSVKNQE